MNKHSSGALRALLSYITARLGDALRESLVKYQESLIFRTPLGLLLWWIMLYPPQQQID